MPDWQVDKEEGGWCMGVGVGVRERKREQLKASSDTSLQGS